MAIIQPSQLLFDLLEHFEGFRSTAYQDQAGVWTIGYGSTYYQNGERVKQGDVCTKDQARIYMQLSLKHISSHVDATTPDGISQAQFDAICDFCYNAGQGAWDSSTLRKTINKNINDLDTIEGNFGMWNKMHIDGKLVVSAGLTRRRKCEAFLYQNGYNAPSFYEGSGGNAA